MYGQSPSLTRDSWPHLTWRESLDCLPSKWSESRSALPKDSHTYPPPPAKSGGSDKLKLNTANLKMDDHWWRNWTFIRTFLFLALKWRLASKYVSLALTWQRTNSFQLTREPSWVHWRWASCSRPKACLHGLSNQGSFPYLDWISTIYLSCSMCIMIWSYSMSSEKFCPH